MALTVNLLNHHTMSDPLVNGFRSGRGSLVYHHLRAAKKELHDVLLGTG